MSYQTALTDLRSKVGTETHVGAWLVIDQARIDAFAEATLDNQWIHVDPERASRESPFGGPVAHGYLTLSLIPHLAGRVNAGKPLHPGIQLSVNYGLNRVRFPHPVVAGSRVRARTELVSVEEVAGDCLQLVSKVTVEIDGASKPACVAETVSRMYF
ncbi:MAG: MaoC family dehydratase [Caldilineaceae bacterium]|nr:MaoC family dehydratase [Caldilineaceae bacterium]